MYITFTTMFISIYMIYNIYLFKNNKITTWFTPSFFESEEVIVLNKKYFYFQLTSSIYTCLILITFAILFTYIELPNHYVILIPLIFNFIIYIIKNIAIKRAYLKYNKLD